MPRKKSNAHGIPDKTYYGWLDEVKALYKKQGNLTGGAQFTYGGRTFVFRKKETNADGSPRFALSTKESKQGSADTRTTGLNAKPHSPSTKSLARQKASIIRQQGKVPDHYNENWLVKLTKENTTPEEFDRISKVYPMGDEPDNIRPIDTQSLNTKKTNDGRKLQRHLGSMEAVNPSARNIFEVTGGVIRRAGRSAIPAAAGGVLLSAAELGQRAQAAQRNPSALNLLQTGISAVETVADGVAISGYTSGVGAPLGLVADGVSFAAGITNGGIDAVRQISGAN